MQLRLLGEGEIGLSVFLEEAHRDTAGEDALSGLLEELEEAEQWLRDNSLRPAA